MEQFVIYGMFLTLMEFDGYPDAYYALEAFAEREEMGDKDAEWVLWGAELMDRIINP